MILCYFIVLNGCFYANSQLNSLFCSKNDWIKYSATKHGRKNIREPQRKQLWKYFTSTIVQLGAASKHDVAMLSIIDSRGLWENFEWLVFIKLAKSLIVRIWYVHLQWRSLHAFDDCDLNKNCSDWCVLNENCSD